MPARHPTIVQEFSFSLPCLSAPTLAVKVTVRKYRNGQWDYHTPDTLSPGFDSFPSLSEYLAAQSLAGNL